MRKGVAHTVDAKLPSRRAPSVILRVVCGSKTAPDILTGTAIASREHPVVEHGYIVSCAISIKAYSLLIQDRGPFAKEGKFCYVFFQPNFTPGRCGMCQSERVKVKTKDKNTDKI